MDPELANTVAEGFLVARVAVHQARDARVDALLRFKVLETKKPLVERAGGLDGDHPITVVYALLAIDGSRLYGREDSPLF